MPIINCGSGDDEHPTQSMLDLFTIWQLKKQIDGLKVVIFGDLEHARTIKSLKKMIGSYAVTVEEYSLFREENEKPLGDIMGSFADADVIYITRMQKEYHDVNKLNGRSPTFQFTEQMLSLLKKDAIILHPGPIVGEVSHEVTMDPRWVCKKQVKNGMYVRMALLKLLTGHI